MATRQDVEKARFWRKAIREAARSGVSIREFCRQRRLTVSQFYWWQRRLRPFQEPAVRGKRNEPGSAASFALVSPDGGGTEAGVELVLQDGRRLRIHKGVDEETLRRVLTSLED